MEFDPVNRPAHYADTKIEVIDYIEDKLSPEEFRGFCKGNALKYISRAGKKGDADEDFRKAAWYLDRLTGKQKTMPAQITTPVLKVDRNANPDIKWEGQR